MQEQNEEKRLPRDVVDSIEAETLADRRSINKAYEEGTGSVRGAVGERIRRALVVRGLIPPTEQEAIAAAQARHVAALLARPIELVTRALEKDEIQAAVLTGQAVHVLRAFVGGAFSPYAVPAIVASCDRLEAWLSETAAEETAAP